jgi:indole-3-glycerol phosphate synthase
VILDAILANKRREVAERQQQRPRSALEAELARSQLPVRAFDLALRQRAGVAVIAEIKRKSPSGGDLRPGASATDLARAYAANGAAALSILTDYQYFGGEDADLTRGRAASGLPVLRKDFVVDEYQLYEARLIGADAVLLIVRALSAAGLSKLLACAHKLGMHALVETHSADEVARARDAGARVIGVNNRDLDTLVTDSTLAARLRARVPAECVFVAESGISEPAHMVGLRDAGVDAVLIGEALVRAPDPGARLRELVLAGGATAGTSPLLGQPASRGARRQGWRR